MKNFWEVIIDDNKRTFEIIGISTNDTILTNNVVDMQHAGMKVRCQTLTIEIPKDDIKISGYNSEENLYSRLLNDYEIKTGKQLKRW